MKAMSTARVKLGDVSRIDSTLIDPRKRPYKDMLHVGAANIEARTGALHSLRTAGEEELQSGKYYFDESMVLYSKIRPYLMKVALPTFAGVCSADIYPLSADRERIDLEYLWLLLQSDDFTRYAVGGSNRAGMPKVNREHLFAYEFALPSLDSQRQTVRKIKECLSRVGEIEKLCIERRAEAELLQSAVFADFVESLELAEVETVVLGSVLSECKYGTSAKPSESKVGCPILRMGNIKSGALDISDLKFVDLSMAERKKYQLHQGDILVNRTNSLELVGKSAMFYSLPGEWVYASYLVRLRVDVSKALPEYVNGIINSRIGRSYVARTARRAIGMVNINAKEIQRMPLPLPSIDVQRRLTDRMKSTAPLIIDLVNEMHGAQLAHLRPSILRKAFAEAL